MSIDRTGSAIFDTYFGTQLAWMSRGIEYTMKKESAHSCALLLSSYTEVLGGIVTGNLKVRNEMRNNYVKFLEYLGSHYVALHEKYNLYNAVRNKLVHEFSPRPSYTIFVTDKPDKNRFGIEINNGHLNFNLQEYYRDFKCGIERYRGELSERGISIINFIRALKTEWSDVTYKPRIEFSRDDSNRELEDAFRYIDLTLERIQAELKEPLDESDFVPNQIKATHLVSLRIALENNQKALIKEKMFWIKENMPTLYDGLVSLNVIKKYL